VSESWNTKYGSRRVKQAPPTIAEALVAAACMSDDLEQQIDIAAALLDADRDEIRKVALREERRSQRTLSIAVAPRRSAPARAVVVEYRAPRRFAMR
jgi:hypothetical protein